MLKPDPPPLPLDHVSLAVPSLAQAVDVFERQIGLSITVSPEDPERHGRILLDRSYIEISVRAEAPPWTIPLVFLRFDQPDALRSHLDEVGLSFRWGEYVGVDGKWDDVELDAGAVPMPILVRRTEPPDVARDWPPALHGAHGCGARSLASVRMVVPELQSARDVYNRLLSSTSPERAQIVLEEGASPGVSSIVIGVQSLRETLASAGEALSPPDDDGIAWLRLGEAGAMIGFSE